MSLTLIGLGLHSENDLSLKGIEEAKKSDKLYIELYTGKWYGDLKNLKQLIGKEITELERSDLEEHSDNIIDEAKDMKISIFVQGDPLVATTHSPLIPQAKKSGIKTKIIHNASIISAIGETGLHVYKFGSTVTIPFPEKTKGKLPESVFEIIGANKKMGLHTLCLLDVVRDQNKYMKIGEGLEILLLGESINEDEKLVAFAKAGSDVPVLVYDTPANLKFVSDTPAVIIIPGRLHFTESEYLELIKNG